MTRTSTATVTVSRVGNTRRPEFYASADNADNRSREKALRMSTKVEEEIAARLAVAGIDVEVLRAGGSPREADAILQAFRLFLLGDEEGARQTLLAVFSEGMADRLIARLKPGTKAA